ncbi:ABC transporter permease, partial [Candidatus Bipolaricaulota bacterium]|nr:ABC transporter permease [Candidatus Bipolaricaulota bacterium]
MSLKRTFAIVKKIFHDLKNDIRSLTFMFIAPIFAMFVFGLAFSGSVQNADLVVVNNDSLVEIPAAGMGPDDPISEKILTQLERDSTVKIKKFENATKARSSIESGEAYGALVFGENFTKDVFKNIRGGGSGTTNIDFYLDQSNQEVAGAVARSFQSALSSVMEEAGRKPPVQINRIPVYAEDAEFIDFFVPGIIAFVVYLLATVLTLVTFVGERTSGTLDRLLATPLRESEVVTGYAVAFGVIGVIQAALLLVIAILVFHITVVGNVFLAFGVTALLAVVCQSLGILLSSFARRESQAVQFIPFVVLPAFLLSGIFWPLEAVPSWLRPASYLIPVSYVVK